MNMLITQICRHCFLNKKCHIVFSGCCIISFNFLVNFVNPIVCIRWFWLMQVTLMHEILNYDWLVISVFPDTDSLCKSGNYSEAILLENPDNSSSYSRLQCGANVDSQTCPFGSDCVQGEPGSGSCCRGQINPPVTTEKPGVCPSVIFIYLFFQ